MARRGAARVIPRRVPVPDVEPGPRRLQGATAHYLTRVLRLRPGDVFTAFDPAVGREADATLMEVERDFVSVRFGSVREGVVRAVRPVTWIQGLAKGDKCDAVVRDASELGATHVVLSATRRSVTRLDSSRAVARRLRWAKIAEQAARQCGRSDPPGVAASESWGEAIDSCAAAQARFCLWAGASEPLAPLLFDALAQGASLAFACGSEGGLDESEVRLAGARGWTISSIGPFILRTETVAAAVLGAVVIWGNLFSDGAPTRKVIR